MPTGSDAKRSTLVKSKANEQGAIGSPLPSKEHTLSWVRATHAGHVKSPDMSAAIAKRRDRLDL